jgi:hypothetical protein
MTSRHESWIDRQIREAQERGEFDNLPGTGKPIPGISEPYDENWWVKDLLKREGASVLPASLALRKEIAALADRVATVHTEVSVREIVADLNTRIDAARRGPIDGPALVFDPVDVEQVVTMWRASRT